MLWVVALVILTADNPPEPEAKRLNEQWASERRHCSTSQWNKQADAHVWRGDGKVWWTLCVKLRVLPWGMLLMRCQWGDKETKPVQRDCVGGGINTTEPPSCVFSLGLCNARWMKPLAGAALFPQQVYFPNTDPSAMGTSVHRQAWVVSAGDHNRILTSALNIISHSRNSPCDITRVAMVILQTLHSAYLS